MKRIAVYGSLKKGKYNHPILLEGSEFIGTAKLRGTLYLISAYPALVDDDGHEYEVEVYKVTDPIYNAIYSMEIGAGYIEKEITDLVWLDKPVELNQTPVGMSMVVYYAGKELAEYCKKECELIDKY